MKDAISSPDDLIRPAGDIFDKSAIEARLAEALAAADGDTMTLRRAAVTVLSDALAKGREAIAAGFSDHPFAARATVRAYSWLTDCIILSALDVAQHHLHPLATPTSSESIAVFAVGGYGLWGVNHWIVQWTRKTGAAQSNPG